MKIDLNFVTGSTLATEKMIEPLIDSKKRRNLPKLFRGMPIALH